ncbi:uncharacterized protein EURHEDRAFT_537038 [Aspergillus ruber CBS 135680]|uniref:MARVEL domain-containing protein n=1 Tax=Aspergillus ruber (strain CBS 135680) TaxID=1388766 RepID=A0A017SEE2_ASPRC|nr:uncharacterized protein EURHEDRAFT_537038 [Aspergillus ruber CBS 135680]EYE95332.1 hypothetical protein EURHEDRAFT_537038 [Aspergillus ruber CBS 135680]
MASRITWIHPVRAVQVLFGIAVFGLIIYVLSVYKYDSISEFMLFNGIWTGFFATPYLALAPVHFAKFSHRVLVPVLETSTMILWLVGVILLGIDLPSASECKSAGCEATLAVVVIAAVEWYVFPFRALEGYG